MKNFLRNAVAILLLLVAAGNSWGQTHTIQDLLVVRALNLGTNGWGVTNLSAIVTNIGMTYNPTNTTYTNESGTYVGTSSSYLDDVGTTNGATTTKKLFNDIALNPDRNGQPIATALETYSGAGIPTNTTYLGNATLFLEYVNPLGSNAPFGLTFRVLYDGSTPSTYTPDVWGFNVAGLATTKGTISTNIPTYLWPGARALRLVHITNQYVGGFGPQFQTNSTFLTKARVVSFVP